MCIPQWFKKNREQTSFPIIFAKILYSGVSIIVIHIYISLFKRFVEGIEIDKKILWLAIVGWLLTSVRSWWFNRTARRLSESNDIDPYIRDKYKQIVKSWGSRNYGDLIPIYLFNYPFLIISIYFIVTEIFPLFFKESFSTSTTPKYIFALILGYAIDRIWVLFKSFPERFESFIGIFKRHQ